MNLWELFKHICEFTSLSLMRIQYHLIVFVFTLPSHHPFFLCLALDYSFCLECSSSISSILHCPTPNATSLMCCMVLFLRSLPMASLWILLSFLLPWSISAFNKSYLLKGRDSFIFIEQDVQCHVHRHLMNICSIGGLNALFHIWNMEVLPLLIQVSFIVNRVLRNIFCSSFSYLKWSNRHILWYMLG